MNKKPSYRAGYRYGTKIGGGSVIDPARLIHSASASYIRQRGGDLQTKLDSQRDYKAGAHAAFLKQTGVSLAG